MILIIGGAYQGKGAYAQEHFADSHTILNRYHLNVKEQLQSGLDPLSEAEKLLSGDENLVIISDEIGYGLVPVDAFERRYREQCGRVNCYFAKRAQQVIRVICGIGERLK